MEVVAEERQAEGRAAGLARVIDAEQFLRVSRATVYSLMERGELAYTKIGKSRRIPWSALYELVARNTTVARGA